MRTPLAVAPNGAALRRGEVTMFDAEIAAKLLNRWAVGPPGAHHNTYLDLLREGNLHFTHQMGHATMGNVADEGPFDLESLVFVDGSRALRLKTPDTTPDWTQWAAFEPLAVTHDARSAMNRQNPQTSQRASLAESPFTFEAPEG